MLFRDIIPMFSRDIVQVFFLEAISPLLCNEIGMLEGHVPHGVGIQTMLLA